MLTLNHTPAYSCNTQQGVGNNVNHQNRAPTRWGLSQDRPAPHRSGLITGLGGDGPLSARGRAWPSKDSTDYGRPPPDQIGPGASAPGGVGTGAGRIRELASTLDFSGWGAIFTRTGRNQTPPAGAQDKGRQRVLGRDEDGERLSPKNRQWAGGDRRIQEGGGGSIDAGRAGQG